MSRAKRTTSLR